MSGKVEIMDLTEIINEREFIDEILATGYIDEIHTAKILAKLVKHYFWGGGLQRDTPQHRKDALKRNTLK